MEQRSEMKAIEKKEKIKNCDKNDTPSPIHHVPHTPVVKEFLTTAKPAIRIAFPLKTISTKQ